MAKSELTVGVYAHTDVGRVRPHNEDFMGYYEPSEPEKVKSHGGLYIVADGMGGGAAGEIASRYAVQKVLHEYYRSESEELGERLKDALRAANADIYNHVATHPELGRVGTTMVAAIIQDERLIIANAGDSRGYLVRGGEMRQVTEDHSLVARLVAEGEITAEEAKWHPKKNVILRSIGGDADVEVDLFDGMVTQGDRLLLCTDGLTRHVSDAEILRVIEESWPDEAVQRLVDMANVRGGKDNISVMLLTIGEATPEERAGRGLSEPPTLPDWQSIYDTLPPGRLRRPKRNWREALEDALWYVRNQVRWLFARLRWRSSWEPPATDYQLPELDEWIKSSGKEEEKETVVIDGEREHISAPGEMG